MLSAALIQFAARKTYMTERNYGTVKPEVLREGQSSPSQFCTPEGMWRVIDERPPGLRLAVMRNLTALPDAEVATSEAIKRHVARGATMTVVAAQRHIAPLGVVTRTLSAATKAKIFAATHHTPPHGQGFGVHWDRGSTLAVQVRGTKTWHLGAPLVSEAELSVPWAERGMSAAERDTSSYQTVTLHPGDVLYVPRGVRHCAVAGSEGSFHFNLGIFHSGMENLPDIW
jgi:ribosomal protein L16 Arg81 hydroxylase